MKTKERFDLARSFGFQANKSIHLGNAEKIIEAYAAYLEYLEKHSLEYDRNEFLQLAQGWRDSLRDLKAIDIPDLTGFFLLAKGKEAEMRLARLQDTSNQEWFIIAKRMEALVEGCNDLPEDTETENILDFAENALELIKMKRVVTTRQKSRLEKYETLIIDKLTKYLEEG